MIDPIALQAHLEANMDGVRRENELLRENNAELSRRLSECERLLNLLNRPTTDCASGPEPLG